MSVISNARRAVTAAAGFAALGLSACGSVPNPLAAPEPNPGPCPNAFSLYDAHRLVEFPGGEDVVFANVGFTGEILDVTSFCTYTDQRPTPIDMDVAVRFAFGRGPAAEGRTHTYRYFIAVTRLDRAVIDKFEYEIPVRFEAGEDRVEVTEEITGLMIPRVSEGTSGANFEVIVGFVLNDEQIDFNRQGLRFRIDAGQD